LVEVVIAGAFAPLDDVAVVVVAAGAEVAVVDAGADA